MIESLGSLGYTPGAAVADLIDNSITAGARNVDVRFIWDGSARSSVVISDDGTGMSERELRLGMTLGGRGPTVQRTVNDLGRFGLGLKTASFSQCRQLIVVTKQSQAKSWIARAWDLDVVQAAGEWLLLKGVPKDARSVVDAASSLRQQGTIVVWRRLTRLVAPDSEAGDEWAHQRFLESVGEIERHLSMTFTRYITRSRAKVKVRVNDGDVGPWDPFLEEHDATQSIGDETLPLLGSSVLVRPFVLPHRSRLSDVAYQTAGGPSGWLDQQGFYVYRNDRLIVAGDWLGLGFRKDDSHILARIAVNVPSALDLAWSVDVRKSTAHPPSALAEPLKRIAKVTRERASQVLRHRGKVVASKKAQPFEFVWNAVKRHGQTAFRINRQHPLVAEVITASSKRQTVNALLTMIDETLPVALVRDVVASDDPPVPFEGAPDEVVKVARIIFEAMISQGIAPKQAAERLLLMPPFNDFPGVLDELGFD